MAVQLTRCIAILMEEMYLFQLLFHLRFPGQTPCEGQDDGVAYEGDDERQGHAARLVGHQSHEHEAAPAYGSHHQQG